MMNTGWDNVANWYDNYLKGDDTYQAQVIAPNLVRMLAPMKGERILDIACGQGYFAKLVSQTGAAVIGVDQSAVLIEMAKGQAGITEQYMVADAQKLSELDIKPVDAAFTVLALENIKNIQAVFDGAHKLLKKNGRMVCVLLHPAFRIPQHSDWGYDTKKGTQYRTVQKYMSEVAIEIELNPHNKPGKNEVTTTFHRPLQWYVKILKKSGFAITSIEEWVSHKKSQPGVRQKAEDAARKEFPMFMALGVQKL